MPKIKYTTTSKAADEAAKELINILYRHIAGVMPKMCIRDRLDSFTLMAVPFFILAGNIMAEGGISARLIGFLELLLKRLPGRLACISVVGSGFFGAISGSNPATVAAIGGITAPRMIQKGYPPEKLSLIHILISRFIQKQNGPLQNIVFTPMQKLIY